MNVHRALPTAWQAFFVGAKSEAVHAKNPFRISASSLALRRENSLSTTVGIPKWNFPPQHTHGIYAKNGFAVTVIFNTFPVMQTCVHGNSPPVEWCLSHQRRRILATTCGSAFGV
jgi:hypothetical protein